MKFTVLNSGSKGNCYLLTANNGDVLIIECGEKLSTVKQSLDFKLENVIGCILTHEHKDHSKALREFLVAGIDCYTSKGTIEACNIIHHRLHPIETKKQNKLGSYKVIAFNTEHDCAEPFGYLINHEECGNVLFITDSSFVAYKFPNLNNIIIEANYSLAKIQDRVYSGEIMEFLHNRIIKSHLSLETCLEILSDNDTTSVNNVVLIHLSDSNSDAKLFKNEVRVMTGKNTHIAEKGLCINFDKTPF